ncbi:hypothetical protein ART_1921 [Arthrobacter sp. PAMC 25486]|uniref:DUF1877 family protein n=1 Tax=Arthrobacter sp. PAMC 25486 TaxID=1494608 RepID=UPI0005361A0A|nr:DUF1877 family protein [Arthrobacter sp. PAMC 25486]AIY01520.1 hypothetical protein ART_1921 [Arthrobacter sp. PAMC 25486]
MGISYFARPVPAGLVNIAKIDPGAFLDDALFWRTWTEHKGRPETLSLGDAWSDLQTLLADTRKDPPRPAYELVRGEPQYPGWHIQPFDRVLDPEQVTAVAGDLAQTDLKEMYQHCLPLHSPDWAAILAGRRGYVESYLAAAASFTAELSARGFGLIYSIG